MIDASIPLGVRPAQIESPMNALARVMQVQGLQQQNKLAEMKMGAYQREQEDQNALRSALSAPDADPYKVLLSRGRVKDATDFATGQADIVKKNADADKVKIEAAHKRVDLMGQTLGWLRQSPSLENAQQAVQYMVDQGVMPPEKAQEALAKFQANPTPEGIAAFADLGFRAALSTKEQLPKIETRNLGGTTDTMAIDPVTGQTRVTNSAQNTATPGDLLTDSRGREQLAISRDQLAVSQGNLRVSQGRLDLERGNSVADAGGPNQVPLVKRYGKPPQGYRWKPDGSMEAVPGGPADIKAGEIGEKRARQQQGAESQADRVITKVDEALDLVGGNTAGVGSVLANVPGTDAKNLQAILETIKANLGFAELQAMRAASPTGGALGAVAVQELIALQSTIASLDQAQSPAALQRSLGQVKTHLQNWRQAVQQSGGPRQPQSPTPTQSQGAGPRKIASDADYNALPSGAEFIAPDGSRRRKP